MVCHHLSDRQAEFLRLHCKGKSLEEIAAAMGITRQSARNRRQFVKIRLQIDS